MKKLQKGGRRSQLIMPILRGETQGWLPGDTVLAEGATPVIRQVPESIANIPTPAPVTIPITAAVPPPKRIVGKSSNRYVAQKRQPAITNSPNPYGFDETTQRSNYSGRNSNPSKSSQVSSVNIPSFRYKPAFGKVNNKPKWTMQEEEQLKDMQRRQDSIMKTGNNSTDIWRNQRRISQLEDIKRDKNNYSNYLKSEEQRRQTFIKKNILQHYRKDNYNPSLIYGNK